MTCVTKQSFSSWGVRIFLCCSFVLQSSGAALVSVPSNGVWMELGGFQEGWRVFVLPPSSQESVYCQCRKARHGANFILGLWCGRGKSVGSSGEVTS